MTLKILTVERLDIVLAKCDDALALLVAEGHTDEVVEFQAEVVDHLESVTADLAENCDYPVIAEGEDEDGDDHPDVVEAKKRIRYRGRAKQKHVARGRKYKCCTKPKRSRTIRGKMVWVSSCTWREGAKTKGPKGTIVGRAVKGKLGRPPKKLYSTRMGGITTKKGPGTRKVRWCL